MLNSPSNSSYRRARVVPKTACLPVRQEVKTFVKEPYLLNHRKGKGGEIEMAEGVGNPVYDSFNEGQPLEDVSSLFSNMDMWTENALSCLRCLKQIK